MRELCGVLLSRCPVSGAKAPGRASLRGAAAGGTIIFINRASRPGAPDRCCRAAATGLRLVRTGPIPVATGLSPVIPATVRVGCGRLRPAVGLGPRGAGGVEKVSGMFGAVR